MKNKTLRRIFSKTLSVKSGEELAVLFAEMSKKIVDDEGLERFQAFEQNFMDCLATLDSAFNDLDRVIDIRDRSLAISSKELVNLNDEVSAQSAKQQAVLNQLQATLRILREGREMETSRDDSDLNKLVLNVDELVKNQLNVAQDLKALFDEGLRISSVLSFRGLEAQLQESIGTVLSRPVRIKMFFVAHLFERHEQSAFYAFDEQNAELEKLNMDNIKLSAGERFVTINSTKGNGILAFVLLNFGNAPDVNACIARVQPLLPNVAATLENVRLLQEEKRKQHLEAELQTARFIQQALLPPSVPLRIDGALEISGFYQNASECGGDWWSYARMEDGRHLVLLGDVTGHGTGSAMVCAVVKGYCDSFLGRKDLSLSVILEELNQVVYRVNRDAARAMTMAAIAIDRENNLVTFANAGHPHPILIRSQEPGVKRRATQYMINSGTILGLNEVATFYEKTISFKVGDQIFLYSDGLTEYVSRNRDMYGDQRLRRFLADSDGSFSAAELNQAILRDVREFSLGQEAGDDITTVVVKSI